MKTLPKFFKRLSIFCWFFIPGCTGGVMVVSKNIDSWLDPMTWIGAYLGFMFGAAFALIIGLVLAAISWVLSGDFGACFMSDEHREGPDIL